MSLIGQSWELMCELAKRTPWGRIQIQPLINDIAQVAPEFLRFLENGGRVMVGPNPILNFDAHPFFPDGWELRESDQIGSRVQGRWELLINKIGLHLDSGQKDDKVIRGHELKKALEGQPVLPAHVLDYLLEHPELIPESWKGKVVFFWAPSTAMPTAACACVTSSGTAAGGTGTASGSASAGAGTIPRRSPQARFWRSRVLASAS